MNLETEFKSVINTCLEDGTVERLVREHLEKSISKMLEDFFSCWGDGQKLISEKLKEVLIPQLEGYDYSEHIVKLDFILTQVLKETALDNVTILKNFKEYMLPDKKEQITITEILQSYLNVCEKNISIDWDEVEDYHEGTYIEFGIRVEEEERPSWSKMTRASVYIECLDEDKVQDNEEQNYEFQISKWERENKWTISTPNTFDIKSLRRIKEFEILLIRLYQNNTEIIVDTFDNAIEKYFEYEP